MRTLSRTMRRVNFLPVLATALLGASLTGCAHEVPPRPLPPPDQQAQLPPWFPEAPWNAADKPQRTFYFGKVVFDTAKATIRPESEAVLRELLAHLEANPDISRIRLEGHTDSRAGEEYNQGLSQRRALAVANWLVDHGLDHNRVLAVAFGETRPLDDNGTASGRQENRRTAFFVAEVGGRRFRGQDPTGGGLVLTVLSKAERDALERQGKIPVAKPPEHDPTRDVIHPYPSEEKTEKERADELLGTEEKILNAATGQEEPPADGGE